MTGDRREQAGLGETDRAINCSHEINKLTLGEGQIGMYIRGLRRDLLLDHTLGRGPIGMPRGLTL